MVLDGIWRLLMVSDGLWKFLGSYYMSAKSLLLDVSDG